MPQFKDHLSYTSKVSLWEVHRIQILTFSGFVRLSSWSKRHHKPELNWHRNAIECGGYCLSDSVCSAFFWNKSSSVCTSVSATNLVGDSTTNAVFGFIDKKLLPGLEFWRYYIIIIYIFGNIISVHYLLSSSLLKGKKCYKLALLQNVKSSSVQVTINSYRNFKIILGKFDWIARNTIF